MGVACPLCHTDLTDPRAECPECGATLAADVLDRKTAPPPKDYGQTDVITSPPPGDYAAHVQGEAPIPKVTDHGRMLEMAETAGLDLEIEKGGVISIAPTGRDSRVAASATPVGGASSRGVDPVEVRLLAKFGPAPTRFWETPSYMRRVRARVAELQEAMGARQRRFDEAKNALEEALMRVAQRGVAAVEALPRNARASYARTLEKLNERAAQLKAVDAAAFAESQKHREALDTILEKTDAFHKELAEARNEERSRAEAKSPDLAKTRARIADIESSLAILRQERESVEKQMKSALVPTDPAILLANADYRASSADFAQFILDDKTSFGEEFAEERAAMSGLRDARDAAERELELHRAAVDSFDQTAFAMGGRVLVGFLASAVLIALVLTFVIAR